MTTAATPKPKPKTSTAKKTTPTSARKTRAPAGAEPTAATNPAPGVVTEKPVVVEGAELRKKELLDKVVARSGVKKKYAKPAVEAVIDILGEAVTEGRKMNLQPLGKIMQQRSKDTTNARIVIAKIRQSKAAAPALDVADRADSETDK